MTDSRVFVTGGSGLVGGAVIERLVADDRPVVALCRSEESARLLAARGVEPVRGDILDGGSLRRAMAGCEVVYHIAGLNTFCLADPTPLYRVNVDGSRAVIQAAREAGVRRVVYTSSAATIGESHGAVGREDSPHRGWFLSNYERAKHEAERAVLGEASEAGIDVVCVNPSSVQGPGRSGGTARLLVDYVNGRLKAIVETRMSLVDIDDCARGHVLAELKGRPGARYLLSGATLTVREGVEMLARLTGLSERPRTLPARAALAVGAAAEGLGRLRRRQPRLCREMVRTLCHGHAYDGSLATRELGLAYTPVEDTIARTLRWLVEEGFVTRPLPRLPPG
jgi:dihydroflavonol-4-reductase